MSFITRRTLCRFSGASSVKRCLAFRPPPRILVRSITSYPTNTPTGKFYKISEEGGLKDELPEIEEREGHIDWSRSFHGLSTEPFSKEITEALMQPLDPEDVEIKPDGIIYLPEIKYRRILNRTFGPGGWGMAPRSATIITDKLVTREYALICQGRLVSVSRGEQAYFDESSIPTSTEGCKSNALMRACKDIGIGSELWDPRFIRKFKEKYTEEKFVEHATTKKKKKISRRKGDPIEYPWKIC
ncbi:mitochondrial genome maintenance MGM101-domain-containing protein [Geopyxis carbonaria]|nr:mitochondrial genome maintenance MGM101-domain-containing protein [Geopyxis carbonaria]